MKTKKTLIPAFTVEKHKDHVIFTGTAMIPGEPDCDYESGEKIFTEQEIAEFRQSYKDYGIVDKEHTFLLNGKSVGEPVEDFLLPGPTKMTNIHGEEREYPRGTWVVKTKITDPELIEKAEKGEIAYSPTVIPKDEARKLMAAKGRVLIKEVPDPVVYTLSFTTRPCIDNSCSVKDAAAMKAGRSISKENKSVLEKARDLLNGLLEAASINDDTIGGDNVTKDNDKKSEEYVTKSDFDNFKTEVMNAIKDKNEPDKSEKKEETKEEPSEKSGPPHKEQDGSKALKNHDPDKGEVAWKSMEHYMGRTPKGRPIKKEE